MLEDKLTNLRPSRNSSLRTMPLYAFRRIIDFAIRALVGLLFVFVVAIGQFTGREVV